MVVHGLMKDLKKKYRFRIFAEDDSEKKDLIDEVSIPGKRSLIELGCIGKEGFSFSNEFDFEGTLKQACEEAKRRSDLYVLNTGIKVGRVILETMIKYGR